MKHVLWAGLMLLSSACGSEPRPGDVTSSDDASSDVADTSETFEYTAEQSADGSIVLKRRGTVLTTIAAERIELGVVPAELNVDEWSWDPWWLIAEGALAELAERPPGLELVKLADSDVELTITLARVADDRFHLRLVPSSDRVVYLRVALDVEADERFYGGGNRHRDVELRGAKLAMQLEPDLGVESGYNERHVPVPLVLSTRGWAVLSASERPQAFDVAATDPERLSITVGVGGGAAEGLDLWLFVAEHPLDLLKPYYETTGYPRVPPEWGFGPWYWRDEIADQAAVLADIARIRELDLPASGYWIDRPYATGVNSFDFAAEDYPDPPAMFTAARQAGLRMALWHTPYAGPDAPTQRQALLDNGWFPPTTGIELNNFGSAPVDLTNSDAVAYWQSQLEVYRALGVEGFKLDFAEDVAAGLPGRRTNVWKFADGSDERTMAHGYPFLYHDTYRGPLADADGGGFILARAGKWGGQTRVDTIWPGDLDADFAVAGEDRRVGGIPAALAYGLSLATSGYPFYAADTGGYRNGPPDNEAYRRWFEMTSVTCVMEVGGDDNQVPWEAEEFGWDPTLLDDFRRYAELHIRLFPYARALAEDIAVTGRSPLRPFGWAHPEAGLHPDDVYFFGDDLLVAPVVAAGVTSRAVTFPAGRWIQWWDGSVIERASAGEVEVPAPLGTLPLFIREGAIIPLLPPGVQTLAPADGQPLESNLWVRVVPPASGETTKTLADGTRLIVTHDGTLTVEPGSRWGPLVQWEYFLAGAFYVSEIVDTSAGPVTITIE